MSDERTQPHDELAERLVLSAMIHARSVVAEVAEIVRPADFYVPRHETVAAAVFALDAEGKPTEAGALMDYLRADLSRIGGAAFLAGLVAESAVAASAPHHARTVARLAVQRRVISAATRINQLGYAADAGDDLPALLAAAEAEVAAIASGLAVTGGAVRVGDILDEYLEELEAPTEAPGIAWHTPDLARDLRPLRPGRLAVVAAWSGVGKSIAAWNYAAHAAIHQKQTVLFHALEMSRSEMLDRLVAAEAKVDIGHLMDRKVSDYDWEKIAKARALIEDAPLYVDDCENVSLSTLRASIRRAKPDLVIVDQIPIMTAADQRAPREQQVAAIAYGLKRLAKAEGVAILAVCQLNRGPATRADKIPTQHDLRESAAIGHAADVVVILHDPCHTEKESPRAGEIDWIVAKQRGGRTGTVTLTNQLAFARHVDMAGAA